MVETHQGHDTGHDATTRKKMNGMPHFEAIAKRVGNAMYIIC